MLSKNANLFYLEELPDYKVADGYSDVRNWTVKDDTGTTIGVVDDLLINKITDAVVYLDVKVDSGQQDGHSDKINIPGGSAIHEYSNSAGEEHIMIPTGMVNLDELEDIVYTNQLFTRTLEKIIRLKKGAPVDRDYENALLESYRPVDMVEDPINDEGDDFYSKEVFKNNLNRKI